MISLFWLLVAVQNIVQVENQIKPIIFLHGMGGVQIEAKLNRTKPVSPSCTRVKDWYLTWFSFEEYAFDTDCFVDNVKLVYDPKTNRMVNQEGVDIRTAGEWGDVEKISYLDPYLQYLSQYFYHLIKLLSRKFGYSNMETMFSLQYDFRVLGDSREMEKYIKNVTAFIEHLYLKTGQKVILVTHSMGGALTAHFLKSHTQEWKDTYVDSWYSVSGALAGSIQTLMSALVGYTFGIPVLIKPPKQFVPFIVTMPSLYFLMPSTKIFEGDRTVMTINDRNYTIDQARDLIVSIRNPEMSNILPYIPDSFVEESPGVHTECVYGNGFPTSSRIYFSGKSVDDNYLMFNGDGDGTVNIESLSSCERWKEKNTKPIQSTLFPGLSHNGILADAKFLQHFQDFVAKRNGVFLADKTIHLE